MPLDISERLSAHPTFMVIGLWSNTCFLAAAALAVAIKYIGQVNSSNLLAMLRGVSSTAGALTLLLF